MLVFLRGLWMASTLLGDVPLFSFPSLWVPQVRFGCQDCHLLNTFAAVLWSFLADIDGILTSREASQLVFNRLQQANLDFQDDAFAEYAKMLKEFRRKKQNGNWGRCRLDNAKLSQLDDMWGLKLEELNAWLRTPSKRSTITAKKSRYTIARGQLSTFLRRCSERLYADEELALFEKGLGYGSRFVSKLNVVLKASCFVWDRILVS